MAKYFTTVMESYTEGASVTLPVPSAAIARVSTEQLATVLGATGPITEMVNVPFIIPALWEVILDRLFAYTPDNEWMVTFNPHEQRLEGEVAQAFLHCRGVCAAFDDYMLRYLARFTMKPVKYISANATEIEFEQRGFIVTADTGSYFRDIVYSEYRIYSREFLRARRDLIRRKQAHDSLPTIQQHDPAVQYWASQTEAAKAGPISRHAYPWFLSSDAVYRFQKQCRHRTWTLADWAGALADALADWADADQVNQVDPSNSE